MSNQTELLDEVRRIGAGDDWLAVVVTEHPDRGAPDAAVVNAGVIPHPVDGVPVVAFVSRPGAKLRNLRVRPLATVVFRDGWEWAAVQGTAELVGPDDRHPSIDEPGLARLLRDIFHAAGGSHSDLDDYDRVMRAERRCAVLISPERIWSNPSGG